jgi:hypothetical protein
MTFKELPIGTQDFQILRENDYLYVDKTKHIHRMIKKGRIYFLSRPRRFGKSLLISTIKELFEGKKKLFEDLYIYNKWDWDEIYPVIVLDFGEISNKTSEKLESSIDRFINKTAKRFSVQLVDGEIGEKFADLIEEIHNATNKKVVILIDEYDKPIIDNMHDLKIANDNRCVLHNFYQILKTKDKYLKFVFLTGVSKFAQVSIFSGLNNPDDITLVKECVTICGYTQEELEDNFQEHIQKLSEDHNITYQEALDKIKHWYDGYSWNGVAKVYNPYSTLLCLKHREFSNNWFNTGTPNFLADYPLKKYDIKSITEPLRMSKGKIDKTTINNITDEALLFQTGYLTIDKIELIGNMIFYDLKIPNFEVETSLFENLVELYSNKPFDNMVEYGIKFLNYVLNGDCEGIIETIGDYLSPIPNTIRGKDERYYHAIIFRSLLTSGLKVRSEEHTYNGNVDMLIEEKDHNIIVEFKQSDKKSIDSMIKEALKQIEEKEYARPHKDKKIIKLVLAFKGKEIGCKIIKYSHSAKF